MSYNLDHSQLVGKEGTRFEFTTYGCPNVTITRYNITGGGGIDVHSSQEVTEGEGILKNISEKRRGESLGGGGGGGGDMAMFEIGYTATLTTYKGYEYIVRVNYIENGKDRSGYTTFEKYKTLAANKCFRNYMYQTAAEPSYSSSSSAAASAPPPPPPPPSSSSSAAGTEANNNDEDPKPMNYVKPGKRRGGRRRRTHRRNMRKRSTRRRR
jgi:hypothetical protein